MTIPQPLIGRDALISEIRALCEAHALVTLAGPGGIGKTALAQAIAQDGGRVISLVPARTTADVLDRIATALSVDLQGTDSPLALLCFARERLPGPLVLDNAEHILEGVREITAGLLDAGMRGLLITSRVPLGLHERLVEVPPLGTDSRRSLWQQVAGERHIEEVDAVLDALGGNPLAIQMVASRSGVITPGDLLQRVRSGRALTAGLDGLPDRHRSLGALVEWSVDLLDPPAQEVLRQLVRFQEPFSVADAEAVIETELDLVQVLDDLRRRYLIRAEDAGLAPYELTRLALTPTRWPEDLERRHEAWLIARVRADDRAASRARQLADRLLSRQDEGWTVAALEVSRPLADHLPPQHGVHFFQTLANDPALHPDHRVRALYLSARAHQRTRQLDAAVALCLQAEALEPDPIEVLRLQVFRARLLCAQYQRQPARELAEEACAGLVARARMRAEQWRILGLTRRMTSDESGAIDALQRGRELGEREGDLREASNCLAEEALIRCNTDPELAFTLMDEARSVVTSRGQRVDECSLAVNRGLIAASCRPDKVRQLGEEVRALGAQHAKSSTEAFGAALALCGRVLDGEAMPSRERQEVRRLLALVPRRWIQVSLFVADVLDRVRLEGPGAGASLASVLVRRNPMSEQGMRAVRALCAAHAGEHAVADDLIRGPIDSLGPCADRLRRTVRELAAGRSAESPPPIAAPMPLWRALLITLELELGALGERIEVSLDGSHIRVGGSEVDLSRRGPARRVLRALVEADGPLDAPSLVRAGWPGEVLLHESGQQRLWQAIRLLRKAGLGEALVRDPNGYRLADSVRRTAP